jgi:hypothetical protein
MPNVESAGITRQPYPLPRGVGERNKKFGTVETDGVYDPVFTLVQARVRSRSYCGVTGLSKKSRARTSGEG